MSNGICELCKGMMCNCSSCYWVMNCQSCIEEGKRQFQRLFPFENAYGEKFNNFFRKFCYAQTANLTFITAKSGTGMYDR